MFSSLLEMSQSYELQPIAAREKVIPLNCLVSDEIMILKFQNPKQSYLEDYRQEKLF